MESDSNLPSNIDLILIGHFGFTEQDTPFGSATTVGGSGYSCSLGATVGCVDRTGVVAHIGEDFDVKLLEELGVDLRGAVAVPGSAPRLKITEYSATDRSYSGSLGVASWAATDVFPVEYEGTGHAHLATMPPEEQEIWINFLRSHSRCTISVDMFEVWAHEVPDLCRRLCYLADFAFMNEQEHRLLFSDYPLPPGGVVIKKGAGGACLNIDGQWIHVDAPLSRPVDTTGAGEILAGSFLALRALGLGVEACLTYAVRLASAKVSEFGSNAASLKPVISGIRSDVLRMKFPATGVSSPG